MLSRVARLLGVLLVGGLIGCGGAKDDLPARVPAQVTVTYKNAPAEGALVTFVSSKGTRPAFGTTDAQGVTRLSTYGNNDGAIPGDYQITITKVKVEGGTPVDPKDPNAMAPRPSAKPSVTVHLLPKKYSAPATSDLKATVREKEDNKFTFDLKD